MKDRRNNYRRKMGGGWRGRREEANGEDLGGNDDRKGKMGKGEERKKKEAEGNKISIKI